MYVTEAWYWDLNDQTRKWSKRFFDKTKRMPTMIHAGVYSATTMYLNAVKATGTDDADAVMSWMRASKHSDMFGTNMTLREDGRLVHDMYRSRSRSRLSRRTVGLLSPARDDCGRPRVPAAFEVAAAR